MQNGHLSIEEIEQLNQQKGPAENQAHITDCRQCHVLLEKYQAVSAKLDQIKSVRIGAKNGMNCPDERIWFDVAAGTITPEESLKYVQHAADCGSCAQKLRAATAVFSDELSPDEERVLGALPSASAFTQRKLAERLGSMTNKVPLPPRSVEQQQRFWQRPSSFSFAGVICVAIVIGIAAFGGFRFYRFIEIRQTREEITKGYKKGRPTEYRVAGIAFHSLPATPRGDFEPSYVELPSWFHQPLLAAQAAFLEHDWRTAADILEKARESGNNSPDILDNLAVAYALEGEGDQSQDLYRKALKVSDEVIRRYPSDVVVYFNRALILEQLGRREDAIRSLEKFIQLDPDPDWRAEAKQKLQIF